MCYIPLFHYIYVFLSMFQFEWSLLHSHLISPTWLYSIVSNSDTVIILLFAMPSLTPENSIDKISPLSACSNSSQIKWESVWWQINSTEAEKTRVLDYNVVKIHMMFIQMVYGYSLKEATTLMILFWYWKCYGDSAQFTMQSIWRLVYALQYLISRDLSTPAGERGCFELAKL